MARPSSIRFPDDLRKQVAATAERERRTFSGEVLVLVASALEARQRAQQAAEVAAINELVETVAAVSA